MYRVFIGFMSPRGPGNRILDMDRPPVSIQDLQEIEAVIAGEIRSQGVVIVGINVIGRVEQAQPPAEQVLDAIEAEEGL